MAATTGIYSVNDLLAVRYASAATVGLDRVFSILNAQLSYDNEYINQMVKDLADPVFVQQEPWGMYTSGEMDLVDEYGHGFSRKNVNGLTAAYPLYKYSYELGWDDNFFKQASAAEIARMYVEARDAYMRSVMGSIQRALGRITNLTFIDRLTNAVSLSVVRLWNNDTVVPPPSPGGTTFAGTHTHYAFGTPLTAAYVTALCKNVEEHGNVKGVKIMTALADKTAFIALTGFTALTKSFVVPNQGATVQTNVSMDSDADLENQLIGYWTNGEEVWVKPYMKTAYLMAVSTGSAEKVLGYRQRPQPELQGLRINAPLPDYPMYAQDMVAEFGFGVKNRGMAAFHQVAGSWAADMA
jgi:hypothetical protein